MLLRPLTARPPWTSSGALLDLTDAEQVAAIWDTR